VTSRLIIVIIGRFVYNIKLELVLDRIVLRVKYNSYAIILIRRLVRSVDV
jgi:hypothetical protein